jgi:hypothetical protein
MMPLHSQQHKVLYAQGTAAIKAMKKALNQDFRLFTSCPYEHLVPAYFNAMVSYWVATMAETRTTLLWLGVLPMQILG